MTLQRVDFLWNSDFFFLFRSLGHLLINLSDKNTATTDHPSDRNCRQAKVRPFFFLIKQTRSYLKLCGHDKMNAMS